tara:strand:+ start:211 stop:366 length:156 start_codon:yes stop_codon:yes gene_type:complete
MKASTCEVRSNRIRKIQNGGYTDIFQREAEQEAKRRRNLIFQGMRSGGRRW